MQQRLKEFWAGLSLSETSSCLYGEGDGIGDETEEYYVLCPLGKLLHVRRNVLASAITGDKSYVDGSNLPQSADEKRKYKRKQASVHKRILKVLKAMSQSALHVDQYTAEGPLKDAFEVIGEYNAAVVPRWNKIKEVWELVFPSSAVCERPVRFASGSHSDGAESKVQRWTTTVTLHCASNLIDENFKYKPIGKAKEATLFWSWTEVHSLCAFRVELSSSVVCEWEHHMQNLRTTPIPCAVLQ
ncbi:hypothetical protein STCU_06281 [Strigomonas culicis]|uniref:Uncharacterized protein n=1 Tax=Strigomonas culicis TaxID=28005 RepID=S9VSL7_9TRYP|nr:hypothetical protein STCU_06281 [Strigomonas culicis]|eukprot:EPY26180.1 hypothetical protein STCU_06281 [Strigomonas culicis]